MLPEKRKIELKILSTLLVKDTMLIVGKLISGDVYGSGESPSYFTCVATGGKWKLAALGLPTLKELNEGLRSVGFEHVDGSKDLEVGFTLVSDNLISIFSPGTAKGA